VFEVASDRARRADLYVNFSSGILLAVMPVKLRFFYRWGMDEHSITLRFEFLWRKLGFGIKIYFGSEKIREKYRFIIPFHIGGKEQHHEPRSLEDLFRIFPVIKNCCDTTGCSWKGASAAVLSGKRNWALPITH